MTMSAAPMARQTQSQAIPSRRMMITDPNQMPDVYSSTPGGTLYSTTPGGTRIVYERAFMMNLRQSPISKTPPKGPIPANLVRGGPPMTRQPAKTVQAPKIQPHHDDGGDTFTMDF